MEQKVDEHYLKHMAAKYIWWKTPDEATMMPERVMAQIMDIGDYQDVQNLVDQVGYAELSEIIRHAQAGQFSERSWAYWHYRLGLASYGNLPPLPIRKMM